MVDESLSRRREFRPGRPIRLADGQLWAFPAPGDAAEPEFDARQAYRESIRAVLEAEDGSEQLLAELALAIHLLVQNYNLRPEELEFLLTFPRGSEELAESQRAFAELAREHVQSQMKSRGGTLMPRTPVQARAGEMRLISWLRGVWGKRPSRSRSAHGSAGMAARHGDAAGLLRRGRASRV